MADQKQKLPVQWMVMIALWAVVIVVWHFGHQPPRNAQVNVAQEESTAVSSQERIPSAGSVADVSSSNASPVPSSSVEAKAAQSNAPAGQTSDHVYVQSDHQGAQDVDQSEHNSQVPAAMANPIPTEEQALADIIKKNQQRQMVAQAQASRNTQIAAVHQAILDSGVMNTYTQPKIVTEPILDVPTGIAQKLKSHQLTAH